MTAAPADMLLHDVSSRLEERRPLTVTSSPERISKKEPSSLRRSKDNWIPWMTLSFLLGIIVHRNLLSPTTGQPTLENNNRVSLTTYGHVHMAKVAGSDLNGELAVKYERICGHKGYSYDAILQNKRMQELQDKIKRPGGGLYSAQDTLSLVQKGYNRGRVPPKVMWEIGLENCDWISIEDPGWKAWKDFVAPAIPGDLELHVPCRDPIDHFLSMCNFLKRRFDCEGALDNIPSLVHTKQTSVFTRHNLTLEEEVDKCMLGIRRFHNNLTQLTTNIKCFDYRRQSEYIGYMDERLQRRKVTMDYVHRLTDRPRNKQAECLLKDSYKQLKAFLHKLLVENYDYYQFCDQCMGSENDMFASLGSTLKHAT